MTDYKLVPAEPTPEMMKAFCVASKAATTEEWEDPLYADQVADVLKSMPPAYRAMLAAAPDHIADARKMVAAAAQGEPVGKPKFDRDYARRKLELVLRDLRDYTADEFWRDISRIASGATGLPSAEHLKSRVNELEAELATARAGWQETIAKTASHKRPAYDEQQQRIAKLESINLGLTKTMVELHAEKAKLVEALRSILGWRELRSGNDFPVERIEGIARDALAAHRKGGES